MSKILDLIIKVNDQASEQLNAIAGAPGKGGAGGAAVNFASSGNSGGHGCSLLQTRSLALLTITWTTFRSMSLLLTICPKARPYIKVNDQASEQLRDSRRTRKGGRWSCFQLR